MLEHVILHLKEQGFTDIVINIHYLGEQIIDFLKAHDNFGVNICISDERSEVLETGGGILKAADLLDDGLRFEMAQRALEDVDGVRACDYEFHLPKPSYTWNTLQNLSKDYPDYTFILLIGGDNWAHFQRWRHWQDILWHHDIIVYPRGEYPGTINVPLLPVSSTEIRERVRKGESIEGLIPAKIESLVRKYYG